MSFTERIQKLPESQRKIILWTIVIIIAVVLLNFYIKNIRQKLSNVNGEEFQKGLGLSGLQEELEKIPKPDMSQLKMPEISEEELKKLEEMLQEATSTEEATTTL